MRLMILCFLLMSCTNLAGKWEGSCGEDEPLGLVLDVETDDSGVLRGEAVMTFDFLGIETAVDLDLEGDRDGREFVIELDQAGWNLTLVGEKAEGRLGGLCQLYETVGEETLLSEGPFELESVE